MVDGSEIQIVNLYCFDDNLRFFTAIETEVGITVTLEAIPGEEVHIVAWGNLGGNTDVVTGETLGEFGVGLQARTRGETYAVFPDDIFWGNLTATLSLRDTNTELPIHRTIGSLSVTIKGVHKYSGYTGNDYHIVVGETPSAITFDGDFSGDRVKYFNTVKFRDGEDVCYADPFNLIPEQGITIDIHHTSGLVASVSQDSNGMPIMVNKGEHTHVLIDLTEAGETGEIFVEATLGEWEPSDVGKEF